MLDFLRRVPAMLGLKSKTGKQAGSPRQVPPGDKDGSPSTKLRGRGTGRGTTPKGAATPRPAGSAAGRKK